MELPKKALFLLTLLPLLGVPLSAQALTIQFCSPNCATDATPVVVTADHATQTSTDSTGVVTTQVPIATFVFKQFTVTATVTSQQSGTLQRISFDPTTIQANAGTGCSVSVPCTIEVIATTDQFDLPIPKPVGGYPAGAFMIGTFAGPEALSPNGDNISMTGASSGLSADNVTPILPADVINATPGTGAGNTGASLPSACTGNPGCKFIATTFSKGFSTQITDTVQQVCDLGALTCLTQLTVTLDVNIKTAGNKVSLPVNYTSTNDDPNNPGSVNPTVLLITQAIPPIAGLDVGKLAIGRNSFALNAKFSVATPTSIDPGTEDVYLRIGDSFAITILGGSFRRVAQGRLFTFTGKMDGHEVIASLSRDSLNSSTWVFAARVNSIQLTGIPQPPLQVPVDITVGNDVGHDLVTASFFGGL